MTASIMLFFFTFCIISFLSLMLSFFIYESKSFRANRPITYSYLPSFENICKLLVRYVKSISSNKIHVTVILKTRHRMKFNSMRNINRTIPRCITLVLTGDPKENIHVHCLGQTYLVLPYRSRV